MMSCGTNPSTALSSLLRPPRDCACARRRPQFCQVVQRSRFADNLFARAIQRVKDDQAAADYVRQRARPTPLLAGPLETQLLTLREQRQWASSLHMHTTQEEVEARTYGYSDLFGDFPTEAQVKARAGTPPAPPSAAEQARAPLLLSAGGGRLLGGLRSKSPGASRGSGSRGSIPRGSASRGSASSLGRGMLTGSRSLPSLPSITRSASRSRSHASSLAGSTPGALPTHEQQRAAASAAFQAGASSAQIRTAAAAEVAAEAAAAAARTQDSRRPSRASVCSARELDERSTAPPSRASNGVSARSSSGSRQSNAVQFSADAMPAAGAGRGALTPADVSRTRCVFVRAIDGRGRATMEPVCLPRRRPRRVHFDHSDHGGRRRSPGARDAPEGRSGDAPGHSDADLHLAAGEAAAR